MSWTWPPPMGHRSCPPCDGAILKFRHGRYIIDYIRSVPEPRWFREKQIPSPRSRSRTGGPPLYFLRSVASAPWHAIHAVSIPQMRQVQNVLSKGIVHHEKKPRFLRSPAAAGERTAPSSHVRARWRPRPEERRGGGDTPPPHRRVCDLLISHDSPVIDPPPWPRRRSPPACSSDRRSPPHRGRCRQR